MLPTPATKSSTVNSRPNLDSTSSIRSVILVSCAGFNPVAIKSLKGAFSSEKFPLRKASSPDSNFSKRLFKRDTKSSMLASLLISCGKPLVRWLMSFVNCSVRLFSVLTSSSIFKSVNFSSKPFSAS